jgi:two-component SAPR family response regulator
MLMNSAGENKGITSQKLNETFWFGMDSANASNNRNVNIRKLRLLLQKIGNISVLYRNEYWGIRFDSSVRCDYLEAVMLLMSVGSKTPDRQTMARILALASRGFLLPDSNYEWMDRYKTEYSDMLLDVLLNAAHDPVYEHDDELLLHIAKTILLHDVTNEDAITIQCRILYRKGQKGQSKQAFDKFCNDYMRLLNTKSNLVYDNIISGK